MKCLHKIVMIKIKNKEHKNVCSQSLKLKEKYVVISTIYNEWFGLGTYTRIITFKIYSLYTLHPEQHKNKNSAIKKKLARLQFIAITVATLDSSTGNPDALVLDALEQVILKTKISLFGIDQFIKQLPKGGKLNIIVPDKGTQKDMVNNGVRVTNDVLPMWLRTHHKKFTLIK